MHLRFRPFRPIFRPLRPSSTFCRERAINAPNDGVQGVRSRHMEVLARWNALRCTCSLPNSAAIRFYLFDLFDLLYSPATKGWSLFSQETISTTSCDVATWSPRLLWLHHLVLWVWEHCDLIWASGRLREIMIYSVMLSYIPWAQWPHNCIRTS